MHITTANRLVAPEVAHGTRAAQLRAYLESGSDSSVTSSSASSSVNSAGGGDTSDLNTSIMLYGMGVNGTRLPREFGVSPVVAASTCVDGAARAAKHHTPPSPHPQDRRVHVARSTSQSKRVGRAKPPHLPPPSAFWQPRDEFFASRLGQRFMAHGGHDH